MLAIEEKINKVIEGKNYGDAILSYDAIVNIFEVPGEERFKYSPKNKDTDIDVNIGHDDFLHGDFDKRYELFMDAVLRSIEGIRINRHLAKFDFEAFRKDFTGLRSNK